jgi:hypothetical protein
MVLSSIKMSGNCRADRTEPEETAREIVCTSNGLPLSPNPIDMNLAAKDRALDDLRTIIEKIELRDHVRSDDPDVLALKEIIERKIERLEHELEEPDAKRSEGIENVRP